MAILSKLKQFKDLREQGKKMQSALAGESTTVNEGGVVMTMDGNLEMTGLAIDEELLNPTKKEKLEQTIKSVYKTALKKMQRVMATKMQEMGGLNLPGLK